MRADALVWDVTNDVCAAEGTPWRPACYGGRRTEPRARIKPRCVGLLGAGPRTHQRSAHGMCAQARLRLNAATREPLGLVVLLRVACEPELPHSLRLRLVHLPPRGRPVRRESGGPSTGRSDGTTQLTRHGYGTANTSAAHELSSTPAALRGHGQTIRPRRSVRGERQGAVRLQKRHTVHCARDERLPVHHLRTRHEV